MAALIQQISVGLFVRKNRYQHLALRVMLAKVIAKSALSVMNRLHNYLLLSLRQTHPHSAPLPSMLQLSKLYAARKSQ
jgi:hypothetical protein